jgi:hypothetical protein
VDSSGFLADWHCPDSSTPVGEGGVVVDALYGAGGAGFYSKGADDEAAGGQGGASWGEGMGGGPGVGATPADGGFGGGGSGQGANGGGGGGGYTGGNGGAIAGGGGSYVSPLRSVEHFVHAVGTGHGSVHIRVDDALDCL